MLTVLHRLKSDEEGQTLVLGAVSMLVLALAVMTTLSISQAAYEKIKLQNTADATAYSMAAVQARAYNFFAYTNRAMVAHYNTALTLVAYLSFAVYVKNTLGRLAGLAKYIPIPGFSQVMAFIEKAIDIAVKILRVFVAIALPVINILNIAYFMFQLGMWGVMNAQLILNSRIAQENDPDVLTGVDLENLSANSGIQAAIKVLNLYMVNKGIDYKSMLALLPQAGVNKNFDNVKTTNSPRITNAAGQDRGNEGRLVMNEIVNAGRHEWVAGSKKGIPLFGRRYSFRTPSWIPIGFGMTKGARTEHGITTGMGRNSNSRHDMIFSVDQWTFRIILPIYWFEIRYNSFVIADYKKGGEIETLGIGERDCPSKWSSPIRYGICKASKLLATPLREGLKLAFKALNNLSRLKEKNYYWFGITPFMKFNPSPKWRQTFNQPQFFVMASKPDDKLNNYPTTIQGQFTGDNKVSGDGLTARGTGANNRGTDSKLDLSIDEEKDGDFLSQLAPGFNVFSVARAYYHRPGDWKEHPNLFNPFWAAKLDPVAHHSFIGEVPHLANFADEIILH